VYSRPYLSLGVGFVDQVDAVAAFVAGSVVVAVEEAVRGMGRARIRRGLDLRPYRLGTRTPVLYSRNQSRTNIALLRKLKRMGVSLPSCS